MLNGVAALVKHLVAGIGYKSFLKGRKPHARRPTGVGPTVRWEHYQVYWSSMGKSSSVVIQSLLIPIIT